MKILASTIVLMGTAAVSFAPPPPPVPEVHADSLTSAVALLSGALLVVRARRKK